MKIDWKQLSPDERKFLWFLDRLGFIDPVAWTREELQRIREEFVTRGKEETKHEH